jgi:hypothetical protein
MLIGSNCPYTRYEQITDELKELLFGDIHFKPYTRALLDASIANAAKCAYDAVYRNPKNCNVNPVVPNFTEMEKIAKETLQRYIKSDVWRQKCKGRELLKAYCGKFQLKYEHFRNVLISLMNSPPEGLSNIMREILGK